MNRIFTSMCLVAIAFGALADGYTNIHFRTTSWGQTNNGTKENYVEAIQSGTNVISSYIRTTNRVEVSFWFDQKHSFTMVDTNCDGRFEMFVFATDSIPVEILTRTSKDTLEPVDPKTLHDAQEVATTMNVEFPKMVSSVQSTNWTRDAQFWGAFSNIQQKATDIRSQPTDAADASFGQ